MKKPFLLEKIFRYPAVDIYMLISGMIAFFALYIALSIFNEAWDYDADHDTFQYTYSYTADVTGVSLSDAEGLLSGIKGNVSADDFQVSVAYGDTEYNVVSKLYLMQQEDIIYPLVQGSYPDLKEEHEPVCVIGRAYADTMGLSAGDTICIDRTNYRIAGIAGSDKSDYFDRMLLLWFALSGDTTKAHAELFTEYQLVFESSHFNMYEQFCTFNDHVKNVSEGITVWGSAGSSADESAKDVSQAFFYMAVYAFALLNCVTAADIWAYERIYELAVKKMVGYSSALIFADMLMQSLRINGAAALVCFLAQMCVSGLGGSLLGIKMRASLINLLLVMVFIFLTSLLCVFGSLRKIVSKTADASIREGWDGI